MASGLRHNKNSMITREYWSLHRISSWWHRQHTRYLLLLFFCWHLVEEMQLANYCLPLWWGWEAAVVHTTDAIITRIPNIAVQRTIKQYCPLNLLQLSILWVDASMQYEYNKKYTTITADGADSCYVPYSFVTKTIRHKSREQHTSSHLCTS